MPGIWRFFGVCIQVFVLKRINKRPDIYPAIGTARSDQLTIWTEGQCCITVENALSGCFNSTRIKFYLLHDVYYIPQPHHRIAFSRQHLAIGTKSSLENTSTRR